MLRHAGGLEGAVWRPSAVSAEFYLLCCTLYIAASGVRRISFCGCLKFSVITPYVLIGIRNKIMEQHELLTLTLTLTLRGRHQPVQGPKMIHLCSPQARIWCLGNVRTCTFFSFWYVALRSNAM